MTARAILVLLAIAASGIGAAADSCRRSAAESRDGRPCAPGDRLVPFEPDRRTTGRQHGTIDLGPGTEVRIGGRVRTEYDLRR